MRFERHILLAALALSGAMALLLGVSILGRPFGSGSEIPELSVGQGETPIHSYRVVRSFPHDTRAFTQGLAYADGGLLESTGKRGHSTLRRVDLHSGRVLQQHPLDARLFGEGLALLGDRLVQLTWHSGRGLIYRRQGLEPLGEFRYLGEGWGLASDGTRLVMSNGTSALTFLNADTFAPVGTIEVQDRGVAINSLNELELVEGRILANVWKTMAIAEIDPATGQVSGWLDLSDIPEIASLHRPGRGEVLNGVAWDPIQRRLMVTGKRWPYVFEIERTSTKRDASAEVQRIREMRQFARPNFPERNPPAR